MTSSTLMNEQPPEQEVSSKEEEEFLTRVKRAEELAKKSPRAYRLKVVLWALIGYLYMFIVPILLGLVIVLIIFLATKISIGLIAGLKPLIAATCIAFGCYVKALWVRFDPPRGNKLTRADFPELFTFVDSLSKKTGVKVDHIMLTREMNASVVQHPRFGLFGFYENYVFIGLGLLLALTEQEFQSVLVHELGHLANHHSKRSAWIYSMRTRWSQIMTALDANSSFLLVVMMRFLDWYQPRFLTLTQVIARHQEREADRLAIEIAGADAHARSFLAITARENIITSTVLEKIYRSYPAEDSAPPDIYNKIAAAIAGEITDKDLLTKSIESIFTEKSQPFDTHPAFSERIRASAQVQALDGLSNTEKSAKLIEIFELNKNIEKNAAETIFGTNYQKALDIANLEWQTQEGEWWTARGKRIKLVTEQLAKINKRLEDGENLTLEEKIEQANGIEITEGIEVALPYFEAIRNENKEEPVSAFTLGAYMLLNNEDESGIPLLEITAAAGKAYRTEACQILLHHYQSKNNVEKSEQYEKVLIGYYEEDRLYRAERDSVSLSDDLIAHTAKPEDIEKIVQTVSQFKEIRAAYLIEKTMQYEKSDRMFLLLLRLRIDPGTFSSDKRSLAAQEICSKVANTGEFPGGCYVLAISGKDDPFLKVVEQHENAQIYGDK